MLKDCTDCFAVIRSRWMGAVRLVCWLVGGISYAFCLTIFSFLYVGLDGLAYEEDYGGWAGAFVGEVGEGGGVDLLVRGGGFADGYAGGFGWDARGDEGIGEGAEAAAGHVDDQGGVLLEGGRLESGGGEG